MLDRINLRWMDRVVCVSEGQAAKVRKAGVAQRKIVVIPNAIDSARFAGARPGRPGRARGSLPASRSPDRRGRWTPEPGERISRSWWMRPNGLLARLPDVGFVLFGEGVLRPALTRADQRQGTVRPVPACGLSVRTLTVSCPASTCWSSRRTPRACRMLFLEACAAGVPVVATAVGGTPEILDEPASDLCALPGDPEALAERIRSVLANDQRRMNWTGRAREQSSAGSPSPPRPSSTGSCSESLLGSPSQSLRDQSSTRNLGSLWRERSTDEEISIDFWEPSRTVQPSRERRVTEIDEQCENEAKVNRPIRVCFLIDRLSVGGTESQLLGLIRGLDRSKVEPHLALLRGEDEDSRALEPGDCPVLRLNVKKLMSIGITGQLLHFRRFLRERCIDVLQVYFQDSMYFGVIAGYLSGLKSIVRTRNNTNYWMKPLDRRLGRLLNQFVTLTVCNSHSARDAVLADEHPDPASVIVIENGVDLERFAHIPPVSPESDPTRPRRIGMVANLREVKGVDILVRAAALIVRAHPHVEFHVAGEGPQRPELQALIGKLGLTNRFLLRGRVGDIPGFLADLDIAVLSSRAEGMPNAVLEYMAAGRPIVASRVGDVCNLVDQGTGITFDPGDHEMLARGISLLLEEPDRCVQMGSRGRDKARRQWSRARATRRFESLYLEDLVNRCPAPG